MSFDLYFFARDGGEIDLLTFEQLFAGRRHYEIAQGQAIYQNPDSGVYFIFEHVEPGPGGAEDELLTADQRFTRRHFTLLLNAFRPDFFIREAAAELAALNLLADFAVYDPQRDSDGCTEAEFITGWRHINEFGYQTILERSIDPPATLPMADNDAAWRWNFAREALQQRLGEDIFVPSLMFFVDGGAVRRTFVWTLSIPTVVPAAADAVLVVDDTPARGFLARLGGKKSTPVVKGMVDLDAVAPLAKPWAEGVRYLPASRLSSMGGAIMDARDPIERLTSDRVLDAETLAAARAKPIT